MLNTQLPIVLYLSGNEKTGNLVTGFDEHFTFPTLKDAVKELRRLGDMSFDVHSVTAKELPRLIQDAMIKDRRDGKVVLSKYQVMKNDVEGVPEGIYIRLNLEKITPEQFAAQTGYNLKKYGAYGRFGDMFQVATTQALHQRMTPLRKIKDAARQVLRLPSRHKGPKR